MIRTIIIEAAVRAMFVDSWASEEEEQGRGHGGEELMDIAPPTEDFTVLDEWVKRFETLNKESIEKTFERACEADGIVLSEIYSYQLSKLASDFGHYMAMQARGHGVCWWDDHEYFSVKIPSMECYWAGRLEVSVSSFYSIYSSKGEVKTVREYALQKALKKKR